MIQDGGGEELVHEQNSTLPEGYKTKLADLEVRTQRHDGAWEF